MMIKKILLMAAFSFFAVIGIAFAPTVLWTTVDDWNDGTHYNTTALPAGDLVLNYTSEYKPFGYFVSGDTPATYNISSITAIWNSTEPNENINVTIEVSANNGNGWCIAENNTKLTTSNCATAGLELGKTLLFRANLSTNETQQTPELHDVQLDYEMPYVEANLTTPYDNSYVGQNRTFVANATILCMNGPCGNINATLRYNATTNFPDTDISITPGDQPFYIIDGVNTKDCSGNPISKSEFCNITWTVNSTGNLADTYKIGATITPSDAPANNTPNATVEIGLVVIISLNFTKIEFGTLDPGSINQPATNNTNGYAVLVDSNSNDVEDLWIKGSNLTHDNSGELDCAVQEQYDPNVGNTTNYPCRIATENIVWSIYASPTEEQKYNLTEDYDKVNKDLETIPSGGNKKTYFWINVPYGIYAGPYTGNITFMANATW